MLERYATTELFKKENFSFMIMIVLKNINW